MKKIFYSILVFLLILLNFSTVCADDVDNEVDFEDTIEVTASNVSELPKTNSRRYIVYDRISKSMIIGKNEDIKSAMASTTKIMTTIVILEKADLNETVTVSAKAGGTGGSRLGLKRGDKASVRDLLYGLMLRSGNDAAVALAEHVGGSVKEFAELMNEKAIELGLTNTHFVTPHGLDDANHYTTALELAKLTDYAMNNETFSKIVGTKSITIYINNQPRQINNTNELLGVGDNFMNLKILLALLPNVIFKKIGAIWDSMAQTTTTAIDFAHTNINPPPTIEQKWMYVLSKNVEHYNKTLRYPKSANSKDTINEIAENVRNNKSKKDLILYRQITKYGFENMLKEAKSMKNIDLYDKGFMCTTLVKGVEHSFGYGYGEDKGVIRLRIYAPEGTGCVYMSDIQEPGNYEVILPTGTKLKIISKGLKYVNCKVLK